MMYVLWFCVCMSLIASIFFFISIILFLNFIYFCLCHVACRILVPWPGDQTLAPGSESAKSKALYHQGIPSLIFLKLYEAPLS